MAIMAKFDEFCALERNLIPSYMLYHIYRLCFQPLEEGLLYGKIEDREMGGMEFIQLTGNTSYISIVSTVHRALSSANIQGGFVGFAATGPIPLSSIGSEKCDIKVFHPVEDTSPAFSSIAHTNQSFPDPDQTPAKIHQVERQKKRIQRLRSHQSVTALQVLLKVRMLD
jgi:hypothetical protein